MCEGGKLKVKGKKKVGKGAPTAGGGEGGETEPKIGKQFQDDT